MLDLNEIAAFATVVEEGGFTAAAKKLGVPKSTVSRRVARLEDELGVRLLQRTTRRLGLTELGESYYQRVSQALRSLDQAHDELSEAQDRPRGLLRVTAPPDFGIAYLGELVAAFTEQYPDVTVWVELSGRMVDLVAEGFDLALRAGVLRDSSLVARRITAAEGWLVASPVYLEGHPAPQRADDLVEHQCVIYERSGELRGLVLEGPEGLVTLTVRGRVSGNDFGFLRRAILAGCGIGLLPGFLCKDDLAEGKLVRVLPDYKLPGGAFYLVYPSARHLPAKARVFRDFVVSWFASRSL
jgi:DNA-binding transcriptional LysR family regulator